MSKEGINNLVLNKRAIYFSYFPFLLLPSLLLGLKAYFEAFEYPFLIWTGLGLVAVVGYILGLALYQKSLSFSQKKSYLFSFILLIIGCLIFILPATFVTYFIGFLLVFIGISWMDRFHFQNIDDRVNNANFIFLWLCFGAFLGSSFLLLDVPFMFQIVLLSFFILVFSGLKYRFLENSEEINSFAEKNVNNLWQSILLFCKNLMTALLINVGFWLYYLINTNEKDEINLIILGTISLFVFSLSFLPKFDFPSKKIPVLFFVNSFLLMFTFGFGSRAFGISLYVFYFLLSTTVYYFYVLLYQYMNLFLLKNINYPSLGRNMFYILILSVSIHVFIGIWSPIYLDKLTDLEMPKEYLSLALAQGLWKKIVLIPAIITIISGLLYLNRRKFR